MARIGTNLLVMIAKNDAVSLFATPTYGAAMHSLCADAATTRKMVMPEYLDTVPYGFGKSLIKNYYDLKLSRALRFFSRF